MRLDIFIIGTPWYYHTVMQKTGQEKPTAFIVGGSSGIGRALSVALAQEGYSLLIHGGSNRANLDAVCAESRAFGSEVVGFLHSISSASEFLAAIPKEIEPEVLLVCFGPISVGNLANTSSQAWERMALANLALPGALVSHFGPQMANRGFGRIVLFGGTNTDQIRGFQEIAAYAAAKTALGVLAKSAAREWGAFNVTCNVLCPGYVMTESLSEGMAAEGTRRMPGNKLQTPENIAEIVLSILLMRGNALNGAILSGAAGL